MTDGRARDADQTYEALEAALGQTARGRAFLAEHARRHRGPDTATLLDAIARLERNLVPGAAGEAGGSPDDRTRLALADLHVALLRHREEASATSLEPPAGHAARIVDIVEGMQDAAWTLREAGADPLLCGGLDDGAAEIYRLAAAQEAAFREAAAAADLLRRAETVLGRILRGQAGPPRPAADPLPPVAELRAPLPEPDIAFVLRVETAEAARDLDRVEPPVPPTPAPDRPARSLAADRPPLSIDDLASLSDQEKLRLFT